MKKINDLIKRLFSHPTVHTVLWMVINLFFVLLVAILFGGMDEASVAKATFVVVIVQVFILTCYELSLHGKPHKQKMQYHIATYKVAIFALSFVATAYVTWSKPLSLDMDLLVACIAALISGDRVVSNNEKAVKLKRELKS